MLCFNINILIVIISIIVISNCVIEIARLLKKYYFDYNWMFLYTVQTIAFVLCIYFFGSGIYISGIRFNNDCLIFPGVSVPDY